ncbi:hypothetical protein NE237_017343 [Protea cynaroides]|uniref:HMA domain-containing protein n=1 Tax=Protea cynaroides TaxID=273540 RepID=A0A9Q0K7U7_9MAGN|nr:hypothetical protein NE237_017343 [Protea cynaroides]
MAQRTVLKVNIACQRCRKKLLKAVSGLEDVDEIQVDAEKGTLTVTGNADPYEVAVRARTAIRYAEVVTIGPPPNPNSKTKKDDGADQKKPKSDDDHQQKLVYLPSRSCHVCERVFVVWDERPNQLCSIM